MCCVLVHYVPLRVSGSANMPCVGAGCTNTHKVNRVSQMLNIEKDERRIKRWEMKKN